MLGVIYLKAGNSKKLYLVYGKRNMATPKQRKYFMMFDSENLLWQDYFCYSEDKRLLQKVQNMDKQHILPTIEVYEDCYIPQSVYEGEGIVIC